MGHLQQGGLKAAKGPSLPASRLRWKDGRQLVAPIPNLNLTMPALSNTSLSASTPSTSALSAAAAHDSICAMVTAHAESGSEGARGWADYGAVFLSAEVQDLIRARLPQDDGPGPPPTPTEDRGPKKRKLEGRSAPDEPADVSASWRICCMDGNDFSVVVPIVPEHVSVSEIRDAIVTLREVPRFAIELFRKGAEDPLGDEMQLGTASQVPLFLLLKEVSERVALESLFKSTGGKDWTNKTGWCTDADLGDWHGVKVDAEGRVVALELHKNGLAGPFPSEVLHLSALEELGLGTNRLTGPIPAELGQLGGLTQIGPAENQLTGPVPTELGQLGALTCLFLHTNQLTGPVPAELGQLGALTHLLLNCNQLTGQIPAELGQLEALTHLLLQNNLLDGQIPAELGQLAALIQLGLFDNQLSGPIPIQLGQSPALTHIHLQGNSLTGQGAFANHMQAQNAGCNVEL